MDDGAQDGAGRRQHRAVRPPAPALLCGALPTAAKAAHHHPVFKQPELSEVINSYQHFMSV